MTRLQQTVAELVRKPRALAQVAGGAGDHEILRAVASATRQGHDVVDVVVPTDLLTTPVAATVLARPLGGNVGGGVGANGSSLDGLSVSVAGRYGIAVVPLPLPMLRRLLVLVVLVPLAQVLRNLFAVALSVRAVLPLEAFRVVRSVGPMVGIQAGLAAWVQPIPTRLVPVEVLRRRRKLAAALRTRLRWGTIGAHTDLVSVATPREPQTRRGTFVPSFYHMEAAA